MDDWEVDYYDAHVKTHQRYLLIKILEESKMEKIKKLRKEKTMISKSRVIVPKPEISDESIETKMVIDKKKLDVSGSIINMKQQEKINIIPTINQDKFIGIHSLSAEVSDYSGAFEFSLDGQLLSQITNIEVKMPVDEKMTLIPIDDKLFEHIKIENVSVPKKTLPLEVMLHQVFNDKKEVFDAISNNPIHIPETALGFKFSIEPQELNMQTTKMPFTQRVTLSYKDMDEFDKFNDIFRDVSKPEIQSMKFECNIDEKKFSSIEAKIMSLSSVSEKINTSSVNIELNLFESIGKIKSGLLDAIKRMNAGGESNAIQISVPQISNINFVLPSIKSIGISRGEDTVSTMDDVVKNIRSEMDAKMKNINVQVTVPASFDAPKIRIDHLAIHSVSVLKKQTVIPDHTDIMSIAEEERNKLLLTF